MALIAAAFLLGSLILLYARFCEPRWWQIIQIQLPIARLPEAFKGYRIAQISDIHMDGLMNKKRLSNVAQLVNQQEVDIIVITGDFISKNVQGVRDELAESLTHFEATNGTVAVPGNHDYRNSGINEVRRIMQETQIEDLSNTFIKIERGAEKLYFAGLDSLYSGNTRLDQLLEDLPTDAPTILLFHEPDGVDVVAPTERFAAQLSGHTHGGQIRIPFVDALWTPPHGVRYIQGLHQVGRTCLYVNRGIGTVRFPLRFFCRPEITIFTLISD